MAPSAQRCKVWLTPTTRVQCKNADKTRNLLKFAGVPQTTGSISAASGPTFTILWGHVENILLLNDFFSDCRYMPQLRRYSPTNLCDGAQMATFWRFLGPAFPASRAQHISDVHSKFAQGHTMCPNMVDIQSVAAEIVSLVWGTPGNFNGFPHFGSVTARQSSSGRQPNCGVQQRAPPIFGRAAITLGIGPRSSFI